MNVGQLKKMLDRFPDDMEVIHTMFSDYMHVEEDNFSVVEAVDKGFYIMRSHTTMSDENKAAAKKYLHLDGN